MRILASLIVLAITSLLGLWGCAGFDAGYAARVLIRQDAGTEDYLWKASAPVPAPAAASLMPRNPDPNAVTRAFAEESGIDDIDRYLRDGKTLALVILRDGALMYEWYGNGGGADKPAAAFSVSKTVVSLLLARTIASGEIGSIDLPITQFAPELLARDPRFDQITLDQLVDMRSGIGFSEHTSFPWVNQDAPAVYYASDLERTILERPRIVSDPGVFLYNDYAPNLIGLALREATGQPLASGPMQAFWSELGAAHDAAWSIDEKGFAWHESGLIITAIDLARIGQLMLDGGAVDGRQVAPPAFLSRSLENDGSGVAATFAGIDVGYRNAWWFGENPSGADDIWGMGRFGQILLISPENNVVIARLGQDGGPETNIEIVSRLRRVADRIGG
ncbi:serine hydrolase domain-containing protein [Hyphococcus sp.]|uniref:serine hydrolase domain-containing protein n=1 Tax=Hyphococcus sp. TaxID=2038636 RepID=UPI0035C6F041